MSDDFDTNSDIKIHTRSITDKLKYPKLLKKGIVPNVLKLMESYPNAYTIKKFPKFVYDNKAMAHYGMLFDYIIRAGLRAQLKNTQVDLGIDPILNLIQTLPEEQMLSLVELLSKYETSTNIYDITSSSLEIINLLYNNHNITMDDFKSSIGTITNIIKEIVNKWNQYGPYFKGPIRYNYEISQGNLFGHPDVICDNVIFDIKMTSSFKSMVESSFLQVLAYYAQMKPTHPDLKYIGFILPNQRELIIFDISSWDSSKYLQFLLEEADKLSDEDNIKNKYLMTIIGSTIQTPVYIKNEDELDDEGKELLSKIGQSPDLLIGHHIKKGGNITKSISDYIKRRPRCPTQFFISSRGCKMSKKTYDQIDSCAKLIKDSGIQVFIHCPYTIKLCVNAYDEDTCKYWAQEALNEQLKLGNLLNCCGVVIHTDKGKNQEEDDNALNTMEHMIRQALPFATEKCPLLLETSAGEADEVLSDIYDLGNFFNRFNDEEKLKLGICTDFAHVWASGYDPLEFLQIWEANFDIPIKLIHFNDSKREKNSRVDAHSPLGTGFIGYKNMLKGGLWAVSRDIPLLIE